MNSKLSYGLILLCATLCLSMNSYAQLAADSSSPVIQENSKRIKPPKDPKKAALLSAIIPGGGQAYNGKFWKLPIVYGAVGTVVYLYFSNRSSYLGYKKAYLNDLNDADPGYIPSSFALEGIQPAQLRSAADDSRQNMEYCMLGFAAVYGLQIVDATVDAHLSSFDVSDDLTLQWSPTLYPGQKKDLITGLSFNLRF